MQKRSHEGGIMVLTVGTAPRLHHEPGRQCSLGRVNYSNLAPFSYYRSCVFNGKLPQMGQEVGEDTPKEKREHRMEFPYQQERISPEETCRKHSVPESLAYPPCLSPIRAPVSGAGIAFRCHFPRIQYWFLRANLRDRVKEIA